TSPSVTAWRRILSVGAANFLPPEAPRPMGAMFDAIRPDLLVFSRSDLWPEMLIAAVERSVPLAVIGATVRPGSARLRWPARTFLSRLYAHLDFVGAVTPEDARRWTDLGAPASAVMVTGDPRHDQVIERITDLPAIRPFLAWAAAGATLVAGSVEAEDEAVL